MAVFGVVTEKSPEAFQFIVDTNQRFNKKELVSNPFSGSFIKLFIRDDDYLAFVKMKPVYPNFGFIIGYTTLCLVWFFKGFAWSNLYILPFSFLLAGLLWSRKFFFYVMEKGLKKAGYNGKVRLLKHEELCESLVDLAWVK